MKYTQKNLSKKMITKDFLVFRVSQSKVVLIFLIFKEKNPLYYFIFLSKLTLIANAS